MKILIIDDNESITKALSRLLSLKGHDCIVSNDGRNGLTMIQKEQFDTVFLDIAMPDFSGLDVVEELSKRGTIRSQPIIVLTASAINDEQIDELSEKGVFACLKKPIQSSILYNVLEEAKQTISQ